MKRQQGCSIVFISEYVTLALLLKKYDLEKKANSNITKRNVLDKCSLILRRRGRSSVAKLSVIDSLLSCMLERSTKCLPLFRSCFKERESGKRVLDQN